MTIRLFHRLCVLLTVTFSLAPAAALASDAQPPTTGNASEHKGPKLVIAEPVHDFGTIRRGEPLQFDFKISNTGDDLLTITDVLPSCGCTTMGEWTHSLKPGESGSIPINVDTAEFSGNIIKAVTIKSNDAAQPEVVVHLQASIWTPIKLSNTVLVFPAVANPDASTSKSISIENEVSAPLSLSDVTSDSRFFKPTIKVIEAGKRFELEVATVPPLPEGTQSGRVHLKSSNADMPEISVQVVATVLPAVQIAPAEIQIPAGKLSAPEKRFAFILVHRGTTPKLSDVKTDAPGVDVTTTPTTTGKQVTLSVTFPAGFELRPGDKYFVRGKTNQPTAAEFEIPIVAVSGNAP